METGIAESKPAVLAPAGSRASFLAALAAGAEAVYCGLKQFTARMEAKNFTVEELTGLVALAHAKGTRVFVTLNTLLKPDELDAAGKLLDRLNRQVRPDAVIVQDLAMAQLVRQTGFGGQVIWSTLANITFPAALGTLAQGLPIDSLVLPRELNIDEIKLMAGACPPGLGLEVFIHGALCYAVSGRCYWSSFLGGKSGLRGRCVQPCRRLYAQEGPSSRFFSCLDLSVDVLVKVLRGIPQIRAWKIEGRKKGPHYVYYIVTGYRLLRDHGTDPQAKKDGLHFIARALGRPGTHYHFLPQRPQVPIDVGEQTGSGLLIGRVKGAAPSLSFTPHEELLPGDLLRIGYEDAPGHRIERIGRGVPKGGRHTISPAAGSIPKGTPVFLIDRREKALEELLAGLEAELPAVPPEAPGASAFRVRLPRPARVPHAVTEMQVLRVAPRSGPAGPTGIWLSQGALEGLPARGLRSAWWWLPPVIFPDEEPEAIRLVRSVLDRGGRTFVLNAPGQTALFTGVAGAKLWAGPFCNLANPLALQTAAALGVTGAIVSPELGGADFLSLPGRSPLPLGIVVAGNWPLCIARTVAGELDLERPFRSPKGEEAWTARYGSQYWVFPNWRLDLRDQRENLRRAGFSLFVHLVEPVPQAVALKDRPGLWNWNIGMQ
jgi:putative protease